MSQPPRVSRRSVLAGSAAAAVGLTLATPATAEAAVGAPARSRRASFVSVGKAATAGHFCLDGKVFRFGGTNCYYLHQQSHYMIDAVLDDASAMGLTRPARVGVRRRVRPVVQAAAALALRLRRGRLRQPRLRRLEGRPARHPAGPAAGQQLARLRRHAAVRQLVPRPAGRLLRRRRQPRPVLHRAVDQGLLQGLRAARDHPAQPLHRPALQRGPDDHDVRAGQRAAQPQRQVGCRACWPGSPR